MSEEMKWIDNDGYVHITINRKLVLEHRYIWEQVNGPIPNGYQIHHINGNRQDNKIQNLMMVDEQLHSKIHAGYQLIDNIWWKSCCKCGELKQLDKDFGIKYNGKGNYNSWCSSCRNDYMKTYNAKRREKMIEYNRKRRQLEKLNKGIFNANLLYSYISNLNNNMEDNKLCQAITA